jgi:integrase
MATVASAPRSLKEEFMARFKVTVRPNNNSARPHLKWVVNTYHPVRGRSRLFFESKEKAEGEAIAQQLDAEKNGTQALGLSAAQHIEAAYAFDILREFHVTLTDVVRDYAARRKATTAATREVVELFIVSRRKLGRSDAHMEGVRSILGRFCEKLGDVRMADLTADQIQDWIYASEASGRTMNHFRAMLHSVFEWGVRKKMLRENPVKQIDRQAVKEGKVGIVTPAQMRALLEAARGEPDVLATVAINGFAGLRPDEIGRLHWSAIDLDHGQIDCGGEITKTAKHRWVKIEPVLAAWLALIPRGSGRIEKKNFRRRFLRVKRAAGFRVFERAVKNLNAAGQVMSAEELAAFERTLPPWPHDALRHSYASYHLAHFKNAAELALQMGHEGTSMLFKNYRARVSDKDAAAWWQLMPGGGA